MSSALTVTAPGGLPFIDHTRVFEHPVAQVFGAYADRELVARWLGPRGYRMTVDDYDFRSGGPDHRPCDGVCHTVSCDT